MPYGFGLGVDSTSINLHAHIHVVGHIEPFKRLFGDRAEFISLEIFVHRAAVYGELARTLHYAHSGRRGLPAAYALKITAHGYMRDSLVVNNGMSGNVLIRRCFGDNVFFRRNFFFNHLLFLHFLR